MRLLILLGAIPLSTSLAFAADLPSRRTLPVYSPPVLTTWTGFYAGASAGAAFGGTAASTLALPLFNLGGGGFPQLQTATDIGATNSIGNSHINAVLGGQVGYNLEFAGRYVAGIEVDAQGILGSGVTAVSAGVPLVGLPNAVVETTLLSRKTDYIGTVRGRLGYVITPSLLVYATGGFAYAGANSSSNLSNTILGPNAVITPNAIVSRSSSLTGYVVGGGLEYKFTPSWSVKVEGLYYDLGTLNYSSTLTTFPLGVANPSTIDSIQTRVRFNGEIARVGVNYHFNWIEPAAIVAKY